MNENSLFAPTFAFDVHSGALTSFKKLFPSGPTDISHERELFLKRRRLFSPSTWALFFACKIIFCARNYFSSYLGCLLETEEQRTWLKNLISSLTLSFELFGLVCLKDLVKTAQWARFFQGYFSRTKTKRRTKATKEPRRLKYKGALNPHVSYNRPPR